MNWPNGTRVRCVDNRGARWLSVGREYRVGLCRGGYMTVDRGDFVRCDRFKPVVRVKMGRRLLVRADRVAHDAWNGRVLREWWLRLA